MLSMSARKASRTSRDGAQLQRESRLLKFLAALDGFSDNLSALEERLSKFAVDEGYLDDDRG